MINGKKILAIIPARRGSKRLPGKNTKELCGRPLIEWTIDAAKQSSFIDNIIVSTNDQNVIEISKKLKVNVPFVRPESLSTDTSKTIDVIKHALEQVDLKGQIYEYMILLQPTSPLRNALHIDEAIELMEKKKANAVIGVTEVLNNHDWVGELEESRLMDNFFNDGWRRKNNKVIKTKYIVNGAIYINLVHSLMSSNSLLYPKSSYAYIMKKENSVDIDDMCDFISAEAIITSGLQR